MSYPLERYWRCPSCTRTLVTIRGAGITYQSPYCACCYYRTYTPMEEFLPPLRIMMTE